MSILANQSSSFFCSTEKIRDLSEHSKTLTDWSLNYEQLSQGQFEGCLREIWVEGIQLFEESLSRSILQHGEVRKDCLSFSVFNRLDSDARWFGKPIQKNDIAWCGFKEEIMIQTPENCSLLVLSVPKELLVGLTDNPYSKAGTLMAPALAQSFRHDFNSIIYSMSKYSLLLNQDAAIRQFKSDIREIMMLLFQAQDDALERKGISRQKAKEIVCQSKDVILGHPDVAITVDELCQITHTSRRALQNYFLKVTGQSPAIFLKNIRLNGVRRSMFEFPESNICDLATQWGFWHLSQFTCDYKRLFGELPSQTINTLRAKTRV
jgi:AraC family transcriptional regulator, ethanolamine operon transcriptional activator